MSAAAAPAIRADGTVLGFDVGARRIGVAVGNGMTGTARAAAVVDVHPNGPDWARIEQLRRDRRPDGCVVGDPMALDGGDQPVRRMAQAFARELHVRTRLPVMMVDERHSSQEAAKRFAAQRQAGLRRRHHAALLDATAAAIILESWLTSAHD